MKIVTDTNVYMADLLKDSIVREILTWPNFQFFIPEPAIKEVAKYKKELCEKAGYTEKEIEELSAYLLEHVELVPEVEIKQHLEKAENIMKEIDIKDAPFIAAAFAIDADGIWSFDTHFREQKEVRVFDIKDFVDKD